MSFPILDYLPCDLTRYSQHVLPAWQAARQGDLQPLHELIASADHLSYWPVFNIPNPLPALSFAGPKSCFFAGPRNHFDWDYFDKKQPFWPQFFNSCRFVPTLLEPLPEDFMVDFNDEKSRDFWLRRDLPELEETLPQEFFTTKELDFWALCSRHLPTLFGTNASTKPQTFLLGCLFYTFCCQLPSEPMVDSREIGNEDVHMWDEYMARSEQTKVLWGGFRKTAPQPLADQLLAPKSYQEYLTSLDQNWGHQYQRTLIDIGHSITGFLDPEETAHLLTHLPTNEHPELECIIYGCIHDREKAKWPLSPELEQLWERIHYRLPETEPGKLPTLQEDREAFLAYISRYRQIERRHREEFLRTSIKDKQQILEIYRTMCGYWNEKYPQVFQKNVNKYYQDINHMETVIMGRFRYAVERGWGMIEIWD